MTHEEETRGGTDTARELADARHAHAAAFVAYRERGTVQAALTLRAAVLRGANAWNAYRRERERRMAAQINAIVPGSLAGEGEKP